MFEICRIKKETIYRISCGRFLVMFCLLLTGILPASVSAKVYKIKPSQKESGAEALTLQRLIDSNVLKGGDIVLLASGNYGVLSIKGKGNNSAVTIKAEQGEKPIFETVLISGSRNWVLRDVRVTGGSGTKEGYAPLVQLISDNEKIVLEKLFIFSAEEVSNWGVKEWKAQISDGIVVQGGQDLIIRNNHLKNVRNGIKIVSRKAIVEKNIIENFAGDGILGTGDNISYRYNRIKNCYRIFNKESDAFQFWSVDSKGKPGKGISRNGVVLGNYILNSDSPNSKLRCSLRGISMFDGMYDNWLIENNVIQVNNWRGISIFGATNVTVVHNTLYNPYETGKSQPRIDFRPHKSGNASKDNIVINNIVYKVSGGRNSLVSVGNLSPGNADSIFIDYRNYDLRLKKGSSAIDAAITPRYFSALSNLKFPFLHGTDVEGTSRPQGKGRDLGAYEWQD